MRIYKKNRSDPSHGAIVIGSQRWIFRWSPTENEMLASFRWDDSLGPCPGERTGAANSLRRWIARRGGYARVLATVADSMSRRGNATESSHGMIPIAIAQRIASLGLTQQQAADMCGMRQPNLQAIISGRRTATAATLGRIIEALGGEIRWRKI